MCKNRLEAPHRGPPESIQGWHRPALCSVSHTGVSRCQSPCAAVAPPAPAPLLPGVVVPREEGLQHSKLNLCAHAERASLLLIHLAASVPTTDTLRMAQPVLCACVGQGSRCVCSGPTFRSDKMQTPRSAKLLRVPLTLRPPAARRSRPRARVALGNSGHVIFGTVH